MTKDEKIEILKKYTQEEVIAVLEFEKRNNGIIRDIAKFMKDGMFLAGELFNPDEKKRPTDIDAVYERNGYTLMTEVKSYGVDLPQGQEIMFANLLAELKGKASLLILYQDKDYDYDHACLIRCSGGKFFHHEFNCDKTTVRQVIDNWLENKEELSHTPHYENYKKAKENITHCSSDLRWLKK